jgi:uncharacterized protein
MPRPKRPRYIINQPIVTDFIPEGTHSGEEVTLSFEEFEIIRLIDYEGLDQSQAAEIMQVSRQTVGRILKSGRYNLSKFVVEAHRLKVEGGCFKMYQKGHGHHGLGKRHGQGFEFGRRHGQGALGDHVSNPDETKSKSNKNNITGDNDNE